MANNKSKPYGSAARKERQTKNKQKIIQQTHKLIKIYLPQLSKEQVEIDDKIYEEQIKKIIKLLAEKYPKLKHLVIARNALTKYINNGNKDRRWQLKVPPPIVRASPDNPIRNLQSFKKTRQLFEWKIKWENDLQQCSTYTKTELLACILVSAAIYGGLCIPEALEALKNKLINTLTPLECINDDIWIDLIIDTKNQAHNAIIDGKPCTIKPWFPDPVSLAFIHNFYINKQTLDNNITAASLIEILLNKVAKDFSKTMSKLSDFCIAAIGITEQLDGVHLSQAMQGYVLGKTPAASLNPDASKALLLEPKSYQATTTSLSATDTPKQERSNKTNLLYNRNYEYIINQIKEALKAKKATETKTSPTIAKTQLEAVLNSNLPSPISLLIQWFIFLLSSRRKVSTIRQYYYTIAKQWLLNTLDVDITTCTAEEFEMLYESILDDTSTLNKRTYQAEVLHRFHQYLMNHHGMPKLTSQLNDKNHYIHFVRAAYIPESAFTKFIDSIEQQDISKHLKLTLKCLYIIAYRTGLRRGELLKLTLSNVEQSKERWLFITENRFGNNKSPNGLRKIPLSLLLTESELEFFEHYLSIKQKLNDNELKSLLFSIESSPYIPLSENQVSLLAKDQLSQIMGIPILFHHFRHTALSRLQIILEQDQQLIKQLCIYDEKQLNLILKAFGAQADPNIYWSIASFAGHLSPESTFNNYLHFSEQIVANKLKQASLLFSPKLIKQISGLTHHYISRRLQSADFNTPVSIKRFEDKIKKNLKKHCVIHHKKQPTTRKNSTVYKLNYYNESKIGGCYQALKLLEEEKSIDEISVQLNISPSIIRKWEAKARELALKKTTHGKSKLISQLKKNPPSGLALAPAKPTSHAELVELENVLNKLRNLYKKQQNKKRLCWCIDVYLEKVNRSTSVIAFSDPIKLNRFLTFMIQLFPRKRWELKFTPLQHKSANKHFTLWLANSCNIDIKQTHQIVKRKSRYPKGKLTLKLLHPKHDKMVSKAKNASSYSTNILLYLFHILKIIL
jgi:integrase